MTAVEVHEHLKKSDPDCGCIVCVRSKGYLLGMKDPVVLALVKALEYVTAHSEPPFFGEKWAKENWTIGKEALAQWREAVGEKK